MSHRDEPLDPIQLSHDDIAELAHRYWLEAGSPPDDSDRFWHQAVQHLRPAQALRATKALARDIPMPGRSAHMFG